MKPDKKVSAAGKPLTKAAVIQELAPSSELSRTQVGAVLDHLADLIRRELGKKGSGKFTLPGVLQLRVVRKKATKERLVPNPFKKGEMMTMKAKPARNTVKAKVLKAFEEEVS
jgi:nucleoid DNA-binding protein